MMLDDLVLPDETEVEAQDCFDAVRRAVRTAGLRFMGVLAKGHSHKPRSAMYNAYAAVRTPDRKEYAVPFTCRHSMEKLGVYCVSFIEDV